jgi:pyruvate-formate lyase-activating enzyme
MPPGPAASAPPVPPAEALRPRAQRRFNYNVEVVGSCNLRCPSCPVGNMAGALRERPRGLMDPALFEEIVRKIVRESPGRETKVSLYDWGEPTLHPDLPDMIRLLRAHGLRSRVSSNLNLDKHLEEVVRADPDEFHVSLSGAFQDSYGRTHAGGDVETVRANLRQLARWKRLHGARTRFVIGFHGYRHNLDRDLAAMRALADEVGFAIEPVVAQLFPLEKRLAWLRRAGRGGAPDAWTRGLAIDARDEALVELLLVTPEQTDDWYRGLSARARAALGADCERRSRKLSVQVDGAVALCCVTFDPRFRPGTRFLDHAHEEIQRSRYAHDFCRVCMEHGLHVLPGGWRQRLARAARGLGAPARPARALLRLLERRSPA